MVLEEGSSLGEVCPVEVGLQPDGEEASAGEWRSICTDFLLYINCVSHSIQKRMSL